MVTDSHPTMEAVREDTILAHVTFYKPDGDQDRTVVFQPREIGKHATEVEHGDHMALVQSIVDYFGFAGPIDWRGVYSGKIRPTMIDPNHPLQYTPTMKVYGHPENVWTIVLQIHRAQTNSGRDNSVWAYKQDDGELAAWIRSERRNTMAQATAEKTARRTGKPAAEKTPREPKVTAPATIADLPLANKPKEFMVNGKALPVKVFGKTHREMRGDDGKRVKDESKTRTATDDVFLFNATAYQLETVEQVFTSPKATIVVGKNGVALLQTIRQSDTEAFAKLLETCDKRGMKAKPAALK